jgi:hypothetical protein
MTITLIAALSINATRFPVQLNNVTSSTEWEITEVANKLNVPTTHHAGIVRYAARNPASRMYSQQIAPMYRTPTKAAILRDLTMELLSSVSFASQAVNTVTGFDSRCQWIQLFCEFNRPVQQEGARVPVRNNGAAARWSEDTRCHEAAPAKVQTVVHTEYIVTGGCNVRFQRFTRLQIASAEARLLLCNSRETPDYSLVGAII